MRRIAATSLCLLVVGLTGIGLAESNNRQNYNEQARLPAMAELRQDVKAALRREAVTRKRGDNTPEILRLAETYLRLAGDPRSDSSEMLRQLGRKIRSRLIVVRKHVAKTLAKRKDDKHQSLTPIKRRRHVLAQQIAVPPQLAPQLIGGNANQVPNDFGDDLVELIERVISPALWDVNGGAGSIVYFAPLNALVVTAPQDVQGQINDLLLQLRAAG